MNYKILFRIGIGLLFFLFSLGQFGRISLFGYQIHGYGYEIVMGVMCVFLFFRYREKGFLYGIPIVTNFAKQKWFTVGNAASDNRILDQVRYIKEARILGWMFGYMLIVFLFSSFSYDFFENVTAFLYLIRLILYAIFFAYVFFHLEENPSERKFMYICLYSLFIGVFFVSFVQYVFFPSIRPLMIYGWDPHLYRMTGVFLEPAFACAFYGVGFFFFVFHIYKNIFHWVFLFISGIAVMLTVSRGGMVSFFGAVLVYFFISKQSFLRIIFIISMFFICISILTFLMMGKTGEGMNILRTSTIASRIENYQQGIEIWKQYPIFGIGYNRISLVKEDFSVPLQSRYDIQNARSSFHSSFLIVLVTTGIIGLIFFAVLLFHLARQSSFHTVVIIFLGSFSFFDNILLHPFIIFIFFMCASVVSSIPLFHTSR